MSFYIYLALAFLIGGIPFGWLFTRLFGKGDIRYQGSGNVGATNVWRVAGAAPAILVFIGDIGKGVFVALFCSSCYRAGWPITMGNAALMAGMMAILGHTYSPYLGFRGGKGVNTALGVFFSLAPMESSIALGVFLAVVLWSRYISLGSLVGTYTLATVLWIEQIMRAQPNDVMYPVIASLVAIFITFTHRENIRRMIGGTEHRFHMRKVSE